jgi:tripartite ATP-independent transporter DctP family solute receptor
VLRSAIFAGVLALLLSGCEAESGSEPELRIRLALQANSTNKAWDASELVRQELERRSNGRIQVLFYDAATLGDERAILEACYLGVIEMAQTTSSKVSTLDPAFNLLDMPYLFVDEDHHERVLNGPIGRELLDGLRQHRLQGLAFYSCGFRHIYNTAGRRITRPSDLNGLKVRVMASPVMVDAMTAIGASATPLAAAEVFQALKTGVVDAAENNPQVYVADKYYEAGAMNFTFTRHFANQHMMVANRDWFDKLGRTHPDLQKLVAEVTRDIIPAYNERWNRAVDEALATIRDRGVVVNELDDVQPFIDQVEPIYERFLREHPSVDPNLVTRIRAEASR